MFVSSSAIEPTQIYCCTYSGECWSWGLISDLIIGNHHVHLRNCKNNMWCCKTCFNSLKVVVELGMDLSSVFGFQIVPQPSLNPGTSCLTHSHGRLQAFPSVVRKGARGRLPAYFCVMDALEYLIYLHVLNLISCYLRLEPFPILCRTTTNAVSGFSEVLVTWSRTVRPSSVKECRGERAEVLLGLIFWRHFSLGLDLLNLVVLS